MLAESTARMLSETGSYVEMTVSASNKIMSGIDCFWDILILAYIEGGDAQRALEIFQRMHQFITQLSAYTYVCLVKTCTQFKDFETGSLLHDTVYKTGVLEASPYVCTSVVDMYAKFGMLNKAQKLLDELQIHDTASWNALISGFVHYEHSDEAIRFLQLIHLKSILPNTVTMVLSLKACGNLQAITRGKELHSQIIHLKLLETNQVVANVLVDMYVKCGMLSTAEQVFNKLPARNVTTWNTVISGFVQEERFEEAMMTFRRMQSKGVYPDKVTFTSVLKSCGNLKDLELGQTFHDEIGKRGLLETDQIVGNALVDMYAKCGQLTKAQEVFDSLPSRDLVSWSSLIAGYVHQGCAKEALERYELMQVHGVLPNEITYACILKACGSIQAKAKGQDLHAELDKQEVYKESQLVGNALIDMYSRFGLLVKAQDVFDNLPVCNLISWNTLISGYVQHECSQMAWSCFKQMQSQDIHPNDVTYACIIKACSISREIGKGEELHAEVDERGLLDNNIIVANALVDMYIKCDELVIAQEVFDRITWRDVVSWNTLIAGYLREQRAGEALCLFESMQSQSIDGDATTIICCFKACGTLGATARTKSWHCRAEEELQKSNHLVGNALVDMYANCGMMHKAQRAFDLLPVQDIISWTTLIMGYAQLGEDMAVIDLFAKMRRSGSIPNTITFLSVISACGHCGLVDKGYSYFKTMHDVYNIAPTLEHHICMVDLLSRAGQIETAIAYMRESSPHPNIMMWLTVLGACRNWKNVELGKQAFVEALLLNDQESSAYLSMYNIYMDAGLHALAKQVWVLKMRAQLL